MTRTDAGPTGPFRWPVRVYWEDTDAGGVVYHANYLRFMVRARTEWLRSRAIDQDALKQRTGAVLVVCDLSCEFLKPARLDDELIVWVELLDAGGASMRLAQGIHRERDGAELLRARLKAACLDAARWTPRRFPPELKAALDDSQEIRT